jgi:SAM-dependent methyltransferase
VAHQPRLEGVREVNPIEFLDKGMFVARQMRDAVFPPAHSIPVIPEFARGWATDAEEPRLAQPISQLCTQAQFEEPEFAAWCAEMKEPPRHHRKCWEFAYILQVLQVHGLLAPGKRGLGFGTGQEPLPAVMARRGVEVLATDLDTSAAMAKGWVHSNQHAAAVSQLNSRGICDPQAFARLVQFEFADMNAIPERYRDFDFCWSSCAFEHLGSIASGLDFVENSLRCLKRGGIAVHTTEYNCYSDSRTVDRYPTVLFRMRDILKLAARLRDQGHEVRFNLNQGAGPLDQHIDVAPFSQDKHLKLALMRYVTTSVGIVVKRG